MPHPHLTEDEGQKISGFFWVCDVVGHGVKIIEQKRHVQRGDLCWGVGAGQHFLHAFARSTMWSSLETVYFWKTKDEAPENKGRFIGLRSRKDWIRKFTIATVFGKAIRVYFQLWERGIFRRKRGDKHNFSCEILQSDFQELCRETPTLRPALTSVSLSSKFCPSSVPQTQIAPNMPISLDDLNVVVNQANHPERLRDILVLIFREVVMRHNGNRTELTGFEAATEEELELAFFRTVNEFVVRWGRLRRQLGNPVCKASHLHVFLLNIFQNLQY